MNKCGESSFEFSLLNKKSLPLTKQAYFETDTIRTCDPHLRRVVL